MKTRMRFGIKLSWPIANIAIAVFYTSPDIAQKLIDGAGVIRMLLIGAGQQTLADRLICEVGN